MARRGLPGPCVKREHWPIENVGIEGVTPIIELSTHLVVSELCDCVNFNRKALTRAVIGIGCTFGIFLLFFDSCGSATLGLRFVL